jgi:hypothetical protein
MARQTIEQRFWAKVDKNGPLPQKRPDLGPCWMWKGRLTEKGYGRFNLDHRKSVYATRFAYESMHGPIPKPLVPDHLCRVRACVCPDHIEPVTNKENILRGECPQAQLARQTHCKRGHPLTGRNLILRANQRNCRTCKNLRDNARRKQVRRARAIVHASRG